MPDAHTILLAEDNEVMRRSCQSFFEVQEGLEIAWVVETGAEVLDRLGDGVDPDLFLLDFFLPDGEAPVLIPNILEHRPDARILVISGHEATVRAQEVLDAGGHGYLRKGEARKIPDAARTVIDGDTYRSDSASG